MTLPITIVDTGSSSATGQGGQAIITGTPTPGSIASTLSLSAGTVGIVISGTWTGTLNFEQSSDGIEFTASDAVLVGVDSVLQSCTGNGIYKVASAANAIIRVRASAAMTGSAEIAFTSSYITDFQHVVVLNASNITIGNVGGKAAAGAVPSGNPVYVGGTDGTDIRALLTDATGRLLVLSQNNSDTAALLTFAAAGASTVHSADQTNNGCKGVNVVVDVTVATTTSVVITIEGKDAASGKYYTILTSAAIVSVSTNVLQVYPGITVAANLAVSAPLPKTWRVSATITGGSSALTGTVGASVIQ